MRKKVGAVPCFEGLEELLQANSCPKWSKEKQLWPSWKTCQHCTVKCDRCFFSMELYVHVIPWLAVWHYDGRGVVLAFHFCTPGIYQHGQEMSGVTFAPMCALHERFISLSNNSLNSLNHSSLEWHDFEFLKVSSQHLYPTRHPILSPFPSTFHPHSIPINLALGLISHSYLSSSNINIP